MPKSKGRLFTHPVLGETFETTSQGWSHRVFLDRSIEKYVCQELQDTLEMRGMDSVTLELFKGEQRWARISEVYQSGAKALAERLGVSELAAAVKIALGVTLPPCTPLDIAWRGAGGRSSMGGLDSVRKTSSKPRRNRSS